MMGEFFKRQTIISLSLAAALGLYTIGLNPQLNHWLLGGLIFAFTAITSLVLYCVSAIVSSKFWGLIITTILGAFLVAVISTASVGFNDAMHLGLTGVYIEDCTSAEQEAHPDACKQREALKKSRDLLMALTNTDKKALEPAENAIRIAETVETAGTAAIGTSAFWLYIIVELLACVLAFFTCLIPGLKSKH